MAALSLFFAFLLAGSALHKFVAHDRLAAVAGRLTGLRAQGQLPLILAGAIEAVAAVCLLVAPLHALGALLACTLWGGYALALLRRRGETLDCGCDLVAREKPVGWPLIVRPAMLAVASAILSTLPAAPVGIDTPFAAVGLLALYLAAAELLAIPHPRWRNS